MVNGSDWLNFATSKPLGDKHYYDKASVFTDSEGAVRVWTKQIFSYKGKEQFIETMKQNGYSGSRKLEHLSYVLNYYAIKCSEREYNNISYYVRDEGGDNMDSGKPQTSWNAIASGSILELLHKEVCRGK